MSPPAALRQAGDSDHISASDVNRRAVEMFGDSVTQPSADAEPSWDIDVRSYESTDRVEHYVRLFSGAAKEHIQNRLERGTRYEPMIRAKMREGGLPEDLYYLALVERGVDPSLPSMSGHGSSRAASIPTLTLAQLPLECGSS